MTKQIIHCDCGKNFPFNPNKHRYDKKIYCPFCRSPISNPSKIHIKLPNLNPLWIKRKLQQIQQKREAKKFLDKYFKTTKLNERGQYEDCYFFPLSKWLQGSRPTLSEARIREVLGVNPTETELLVELQYLEKLGVTVKP